MLPGSSIDASMIYGTAWKKDNTADLVTLALKSGFRAFDTAAQPKHYNEHALGEAIRKAIGTGFVTRQDLYLQTKFTPPSGQDTNDCPYDLSADTYSQVIKSVESSLWNLRYQSDASVAHESYIDCLILHSPLPSLLSTMTAWRAMSSFVPSRVRCLGISNTTLPVLKAVYSHALVKPSIVQNRFYSKTGWDLQLREYCTDNGIRYEGFWVLSANQVLLDSEVVKLVASTTGIEKAVVLYTLLSDLCIYVLNGTSREERMRSDMKDFEHLKAWKNDEDNKKQWSAWLLSLDKILKDYRAMDTINHISPVIK